MALVASAFNWVSVRSGIWTSIYQGPLVSGIPFQALEIATPTGGPITFTLDGYSASPPFYQRNATTASTSGTGSSPPLGSTGNWAVVLSYVPSPWVDFRILTNRNCFAHIAMF